MPVPRSADESAGDADAEVKSAAAPAKAGATRKSSHSFAGRYHEVVAAMEAGKKKVSQPVADYAKMLHTQHASTRATDEAWVEIEVTPRVRRSECTRIKGAGEMA